MIILVSSNENQFGRERHQSIDFIQSFFDARDRTITQLDSDQKFINSGYENQSSAWWETRVDDLPLNGKGSWDIVLIITAIAASASAICWINVKEWNGIDKDNSQLIRIDRIEDQFACGAVIRIGVIKEDLMIQLRMGLIKLNTHTSSIVETNYEFWRGGAGNERHISDSFFLSIK